MRSMTFIELFIGLDFIFTVMQKKTHIHITYIYIYMEKLNGFFLCKKMFYEIRRNKSVLYLDKTIMFK